MRDRISTPETEVEDEQEEAMTRSLIIAHQCTVDTLEQLEEEVFQQPADYDLISRSLTPEIPLLGRVVRAPVGHKPSRSVDNRDIRSSSPAKDLASQRASEWINNLIFDNSPLPLGFRRQTWGAAECALFLEQQPYYFLQKWTDQGEHLHEMQRQSIRHLEEPEMQEVSTNRNYEETSTFKNLTNSVTDLQNQHQQQSLPTSARNLNSIPHILTTIPFLHDIAGMYP